MRLLRGAAFTAGALLALQAVFAAPLAPSPSTCALELSARDASGNTVQQTVAFALDRPGLLLAPLSLASRLRSRWERLQVLSDPSLSGAGVAGGGVEVTEVLLRDEARDLVLLRAPGLEACELDRSQTSEADAAAAATVAPGEKDRPLIGIRDRDGYRPRVFQARLDKTIATGPGQELFRIRIPDGGGAGAGFLFDDRNRLIGSLLPPPPGGDRSFACAVAVDRREFDVAAAEPGRPVASAFEQAPAADFARSPAGLWSRALLLTRDDQVDEALRLLEEVEHLSGESDTLLMERGVRRFRIGRTDASIEDFARAARLNPHLHLAEFDLGVALGAAGRYPQAIEAFSRALEIDPRHAQTHYQMAVALLAARLPERAREEYARLLPLDPALAADLQAALSPITTP